MQSIVDSVPADQQIAPHLEGDETVTLTNLCPPHTPGSEQDAYGNTQLSFKLPGHLPFVLVRYEEGQLGELAAKLDTLIIEADTKHDPADQKLKVVCVWRATVASLPEIRVLEARMIAAADVELQRNQQHATPAIQPTPLSA